MLKIPPFKLFSREKKVQSKKQINNFDMVRDPLLRKLNNVRKVLNKFQNKTCNIQT